MNNAYEKVKEFHKAFEHPTAEHPTPLTDERIKKRATWMAEEIIELAQAQDVVEQADALADIMYFCLGTFVEMGVKPEAIFNMVHKANMAKLFPDGKVHKEGTKTIKPPGWTGPEMGIHHEIKHQRGDFN